MWIAIGHCSYYSRSATFAITRRLATLPIRRGRRPPHPGSSCGFAACSRIPSSLPILLWLRDFGWPLTWPQFTIARRGKHHFADAVVLILLGAPYIDAGWTSFGDDHRRARTKPQIEHRGWDCSRCPGSCCSRTWARRIACRRRRPPLQLVRSFCEHCAPAPIPLLPLTAARVRRIGYAGCPIGTYESGRNSAAPSADRFPNLLPKMQIRIQQSAAMDSPMRKDFSSSKMADRIWKRMTLRITWTPRTPGDPGSFEKTIFLLKTRDMNKNSNYDYPTKNSRRVSFYHC